MSLEEFELLVLDVVNTLPQEFLEKLDNVEVTVQAWPTHQELGSLGLRSPYQLFGLYQGVPQPKRSSAFQLPDKITIFAGPILSAHRTEMAVRDQVARTVKHEIAHHFGIGEERLREKGY